MAPKCDQACAIAHAALTRPMWLKACGKLPSRSPVSGSTSSEQPEVVDVAARPLEHRARPVHPARYGQRLGEPERAERERAGHPVAVGAGLGAVAVSEAAGVGEARTVRPRPRRRGRRARRPWVGAGARPARTRAAAQTRRRSRPHRRCTPAREPAAAGRPRRARAPVARKPHFGAITLFSGPENSVMAPKCGCFGSAAAAGSTWRSSSAPSSAWSWYRPAGALAWTPIAAARSVTAQRYAAAVADQLGALHP
jgi:hypothetical protein